MKNNQGTADCYFCPQGVAQLTSGKVIPPVCMYGLVIHAWQAFSRSPSPGLFSRAWKNVFKISGGGELPFFTFQGRIAGSSEVELYLSTPLICMYVFDLLRFHLTCITDLTFQRKFLMKYAFSREKIGLSSRSYVFLSCPIMIICERKRWLLEVLSLHDMSPTISYRIMYFSKKYLVCFLPPDLPFRSRLVMIIHGA